jgi:IclR family acetate operon transcriptional repressor
VAAIFADQDALTALTSRSITSCPRLLAELRTVRAQGCAVNVEESEDGVVAVAVAVRGTRRAPSAIPAAAISVSGPVSRMTGPAIEKIAAKLRERATELANLI